MNPQARAVALPASVAANPRLGDWLRVLPSGVVEVRPGKVELGQGVLTALSQVAAEELDISVARVRMIPAATGASPDEGYTAGSLVHPALGLRHPSGVRGGQGTLPGRGRGPASACQSAS